MLYVFDFDGTLASWPRDVQPQYVDARQSVMDSAARLGPLRFLKHLQRQGHSVCILTGRSQSHAVWLRFWLQTFAGTRVEVIARPSHIGLACGAQAAWKSKELRRIKADAYVGDNERIDRRAAELAGVPFVDASELIAGKFLVLARWR